MRLYQTPPHGCSRGPSRASCLDGHCQSRYD
jgi:hypothetical protein